MHVQMYLHSRLHRRWMGSVSLLGLTLFADVIGAVLTALAIGVSVPVIQRVLVWSTQALSLLIQHLLSSLTPDVPFIVCLGVGALVGLLLALGTSGAFNSPYSSYKGSIGKGLLAFVITMAVALLCWVLISAVFHRAPLRIPPFPPINLVITTGWAVFGLCYYLLVHLISALTAAKEPLLMPGQCSYQMHLTLPPAPPQSLVVLTEQNAPVIAPSYPSTRPLSRAHPGGPKWALIQQCYQLYQKALTRFAMPSLDLRLPEGFRYYEGGQQMYWYEHTLLIPRQFLDHAWRHALLPELARQLLYVNAPDLWILEYLASYPRYASETFLLLATLNFLWLPTIVKNLAMACWMLIAWPICSVRACGCAAGCRGSRKPTGIWDSRMRSFPRSMNGLST